MRLSELATISAGIRITKRSLSADWGGQAYRLIQVHDLAGGRVRARSKLKTVYLGGARKPQEHQVLVGDILIATSGKDPLVARVATNLAWCLADELIAIVRPQSGEEGKRILEYLVSEDGQRRLESAKGGALVRRLALEDLGRIEIP
jgi:hypothetical protein